ncbi:MAG: 30S ribosomal protein S3, partial [Planctomycetes bacterium]|nr:30S ribosomal protein S3 [Planctomycetota bacterium]
LQKHIDYGLAEAKTTMGVIGVKVWINRGNYQDSETQNGVDAQAGEAPKRAKRASKR